MPLPGDVSTFTLTFGPYTDAAGYTQLAGTTGKLTPVDANGVPVTVLHAGDGSVIVPATILVTIGSDGTESITGLAHTDDTHLSPSPFLYQMTWDAPAYRSLLKNKLFAVPIASGATVDFDLLANGTTTTGVAINLPSVISVNGQSGAVTLGKADVGLGSVDNTSDANKPISTATQTALNAKAALGGLYKKFTDLPASFIVPHRGAGANIAPDNTLEAFRIGAGYGLGIVDGGDLRVLSDGTIANMHDRALPFTTLNGTGTNVDDLSAAGWRLVVIDAGRWFGGGWGNLSACTLSQLLSEFGPNYLMTPEWKNDYGGTGYTAVVDRIVQAGLASRVMFNSFSVQAVQYAIAQGIGTVCLNVLPTQTLAQTQTALGGTVVQWIGISTISGLTDSLVTDYHNAGYKIILSDCVRQVQKAHYDALGVNAYYGNDPLYMGGDVTKYRRTNAPWTKSGTFYHGHLSPTSAVDANRGQFVGTVGASRWQQTLDGYVLQGWACPLANAAGSYTLTVPITFDTLPGDMTRHADIGICFPTDDVWNSNGETTGNGYNILCRANGTVQIYKYTAGAVTGPLATATGSALAAGQVASLVIAVTPTTITVTPTLNGVGLAPISITDSSFRGGFFFLGNGGATSGMRASFGAITVS